jgi:endonuclease YncB( thermonuclease family)
MLASSPPLLPLLLVATILSQVLGELPVATAGDQLVEATVTRAVDGSSLDAHVFGARTALGYLGAEVLPSNEPCGREALDRNRELAGTQVLVLGDPTYQLDDRGRRLYYAFTLDGQSIDGILIREGLARAARTDARYGPELAALQAEAEAAHRGCLWGDART